MKKLFWYGVQQGSLRAASCWTASSQTEYSDIRARGIRQPIAIIPQGIDVPAYKKFENSSRTLLFLSRIHPVKGLENLLMAWRELAPIHSEWSLRIVGPGSVAYIAELMNLSKLLALKRVEFLPEVYGAEKSKIMQSAELFVLPSHSDSFAVAVAEAMAHGLPVVVTDKTPWINVEGEGVGWLAEDDYPSLTEKLDEAMKTELSSLRLK